MKELAVEESRKVGLESMDIAEEKREQLRAVFPEVFSEGKVDFDQLKHVLGEWIDPGKERFGLNWPGKADCMRIIQQSSVATLRPARDESINFNETENLFIEGDNLEVLKLLQKAYFGKVKMIYIDPPYNTGKEFIYPDKYAETLDTYLEYTGQKDSDGKKFSTNTDASGRYHSRWLNMMYPRLYLARNLLRDDGCVFISIDDNELANLLSLCHEIFGEENFIEAFVWNKKTAPNNVVVGSVHEYILMYAKNKECADLYLLPRDEDNDRSYKNPDNDPRGRWKPDNLTAAAKGGRETPSLIYKITNPITGEEYSPPKGRMWAVSQPEMMKKIEENTVYWGKDGRGRPMDKRFLSRTRDGTVVSTWLDDVGTNSSASKYLSQLFDGAVIFETPKPVDLIKRFAQISLKEGQIALDFFAGSASTAHAIMDLNAESGGNNKFIMVQLPEPIEEKSEPYKAGYKTISDISRERMSRAGKKIAENQSSRLDVDNNGGQDLGFKVFKLACSNFKVWKGDISENDLDDPKNLTDQLEMHVNHIDESSTSEDILYELLLKGGYPLDIKIEKIHLAGKEIFSIEGGVLLICLDRNLTQDVVDAMAEIAPQQVICLDEGFKDNDQLKANAVQTFKSQAQRQEREIVFRTV